MQDIIAAVSTCGFPIVIALLELYYIVSRLDKMTDVINNNTLVLKEITTLLKEGDEN